MAIRPRPWTRSDLERIPDDTNKYEVVRGELFVTPAPSTRHERLLRILADLIRPYVSRDRLGVIGLGHAALVFEESEVQPDLVVRVDPGPTVERWEEMPTPILVVEVLSRSTRQRDLRAKRELYADAGIDEYWIVDGDARSIRRFRVGTDEVLSDRLEWSPVGTTASLTIDLVDYFRRALG